MNKLWKVILFSVLGLFGVIGVTAGIMFLTGAFNPKKIYPENISFSSSRYEAVSDFSMIINTSTEEFTESLIQLDFSNIVNPTKKDGYISDGIITVPEFVNIGRAFTCKVNKLEDGFNNGGKSTLRARLVNSNIDFVTTNVFIDVPVDSIEIYATNESGQTVTSFAKGSIISLNANFIPSRSEDPYRTRTDANPEGDKKYIKRVEYEVSQDYLEKYVKFLNVNNVTYYDKLEVIGLTSTIADLKAVVNAYVFSTLEEQNAVSEEDYNEDRFTNIRTSGVSGETKFETVNVELNELNFTKINNLKLNVNRFYNFYVKNNTSVNIPEYDKYFNITVKSNVENVDVSYRLNDLTLKAFYKDGTEVPSDLISITFVKDIVNPLNNFWKVIVNDTLNSEVYFEFKIADSKKDYILTQDFTFKIINIETLKFNETEKTLTFIDYEGEEHDVFEQIDLNKLIVLTGENGEIPTYTKIIYYIENYSNENQIVKSDNGFINNGVVIPKSNGSVTIIAKVVKTKGQNIVYDENNKYIFIDNFEAKITINVNEGLTNLNISLIDNDIEKISNGYLEDTDKIYKDISVNNVTYKKLIDALLLKVSSNNKPEIIERELLNSNGLKFTTSNPKVNLLKLYDDINVDNFNYVINLKTFSSKFFSFNVTNFNVTINSLKEIVISNEVLQENEITNIEDYVKVLKNVDSSSASLMLTNNRFSSSSGYLINITFNGNTFNIILSSDENIEVINDNYKNSASKIVNFNLDSLPLMLTNDVQGSLNGVFYNFNIKMLYVNGSFIKPSSYSDYIINNGYYIELKDNYREVVCDIELLYKNEENEDLIKEIRLTHNNNGMYYGILKKCVDYNEETDNFDIYYICKISLMPLDTHNSINVDIDIDYINNQLNVNPIRITIISKKVTEVSFEHNVYDGDILKETIGTINNPIIINGKIDGDNINWSFEDESYKNVIFDEDLNLKYTIYPNHASGFNISSENNDSILVIKNDNNFKINFVGIPSGLGSEEIDKDNSAIRNNTYLTYVEIQSDYESDTRYDRLYFKFITPVIEAESYYKDNLNYYKIIGKVNEGFNLFTTVLDTKNGINRYPVEFYYYDLTGNKNKLTNSKFKIEDISSVKYSEYYSIDETGNFKIIKNSGFNYSIILQISHSFGKSIQYEINVESILDVKIEYPTETNLTKNLVYGNYVIGDGLNGSEVNKKYFVLPAGINGGQKVYSLLNIQYNDGVDKIFIKSTYKESSGFSGSANLIFELTQSNDFASIEGDSQLVISSEKIGSIKYLKLKVYSIEGYLDYVYIALVPNIKIDEDNIDKTKLEIYAGENNKIELIKFDSNYNYDYDNSIIKLISRDASIVKNFSFTNLDRTFSLSEVSNLELELLETGINIVSKNVNLLSEYKVKFKINYYNYILSIDITIKPNLFLNGNGQYNSDGESTTGLYNIKYNSEDNNFNSKLIVASYNTSYLKLFDLKDSNSLLFNYIKKYSGGNYVNVSTDNFTYSLLSTNLGGIKLNNGILEIPSYNMLTGIYNFTLRATEASGCYIDINLTVSPFNLLSTKNDGTIFANITNNYDIDSGENKAQNIDFYKFFSSNSLNNVIYSYKINAGTSIKLVKEEGEGLFELNIINAEGEYISILSLDEGLSYEIIYLDSSNKYAEIKGNSLNIYDIASKDDTLAKFAIKIKSSRLENSGFNFIFIVEIIPNLSFKINLPIENEKSTESIILQDGEKATINLREVISSKYPNNVGRKRLEIYNKNNALVDIADNFNLNYLIESGNDAVESILVNNDGIFVNLKYTESTTIVKIKFYHENGLVGYYNFEVKSSPKYSIVELKENKTGELLNDDNYQKVNKYFDLTIDDNKKIIFGKTYSQAEAEARNNSFDYKILNITEGIKNITFDNNLFYKLNIDNTKDNYNNLYIYNIDNETIISFISKEDYLSKSDEDKTNEPKLVLKRDGNDISVYSKCGVNSISGNLIIYTLDGVIANINIKTEAKYSSSVENTTLDLYSNQTYSLKDLIEITDKINNTSLEYNIYLIDEDNNYINNNKETVSTGEEKLIIAGLNNTVENNVISVRYVAEFDNGDKYYGVLNYNIVSSIKDSSNNIKLWPYNYIEDVGSYTKVDKIEIKDLITIVKNDIVGAIEPELFDINWANSDNIVLIPSSFQDLASKYFIFKKGETEVNANSNILVINGVSYYQYDCDSICSKQVNDYCEIELKIFNTKNKYLFDSNVKITLYTDLVAEINYNKLNDEEILETIYVNTKDANYKYYLYGENNKLLFTDKKRISFSTITGRPLIINKDIIFTILNGSEYVNLNIDDEEGNVYLTINDTKPSNDTIIKIQIKVDNLLTYYYNINLSLTNPYLCEVVYDKTDNYYENDEGIIRQFITFESEAKTFNLISKDLKFYINFVYNTVKNNNNQTVSLDINSFKNLFNFSIIGTNFSFGEDIIPSALQSNSVYFNTNTYELYIAGENSTIKPQENEKYTINIKDKHDNNLNSFNFRLKRNWKINENNPGFNGTTLELYALKNDIKQTYNLLNLIGLTDLYGNMLSTEQTNIILNNMVITIDGNIATPGYTYVNYNTSTGELEINGAPNNGKELTIKIKIFETSLQDFNIKVYSGISVVFEDSKLDTNSVNKNIVFDEEDTTQKDFVFYSSNLNNVQIYYNNNYSQNILKDSNLVKFYVKGDLEYLSTSYNTTPQNGYYLTNLESVVGGYGLVFNQPMLGEKNIILKIVDNYGYEVYINFTLTPKYEIVLSTNELEFDAGDYVNLFNDGTISIKPNKQSSVTEQIPEYYIKNIEVAYDNYSYTSVYFVGEKTSIDENGNKIYGRFKLDSSITSSTSYNVKFRITLGSGKDTGVIIIDKVKVNPSVYFTTNYGNTSYAFNVVIGEIVDVSQLYNFIGNIELESISYEITKYTNGEYVYTDDLKCIKNGLYQSSTDNNLINNIYRVEVKYTYNGISKSNYVFIKLNKSLNISNYNNNAIINVNSDATEIQFNDYTKDITFVDYNGNTKLVRLDDKNISFALHSTISGISIDRNGKTIKLDQENINFTSAGEGFKNIIFDLDMNYYGTTYENFIRINLNSYTSMDYVNSYSDIVVNSNDMSSYLIESDYYLILLNKIKYTNLGATISYSIKSIRINNQLVTLSDDIKVESDNLKVKNLTDKDIEICLNAVIDGTTYIQNIFIYNNNYNLNINNYCDVITNEEIITGDNFEISIENNKLIVKKGGVSLLEKDIQIFNRFGEIINSSITLNSASDFSSKVDGYVEQEISLIVEGEELKFTLRIFDSNNNFIIINKNYGAFKTDNSSSKIELNYNPKNEYPYYVWNNKVDLKLIQALDGHINYITNLANIKDFASLQFEGIDCSIEEAYVDSKLIGFNITNTTSLTPRITVKLNNSEIYTIHFNISKSVNYSFINAYQGDYISMGETGYPVVADFNTILVEGDDSQIFNSNIWASNIYVLEYESSKNNSYKGISIFDVIKSFDLTTENGTGFSVEENGNLIIPKNYSGLVKIKAKVIDGLTIDSKNEITFSVYITNKTEFNFVETKVYDIDGEFKNMPYLTLSGFGDGLSITFLRYDDSIIESAQFNSYVKLAAIAGINYLFFTNENLKDNNYLITIKNSEGKEFNLVINRKYKNLTTNQVNITKNSLTYSEWANTIKIVAFNFEDNILKESNLSYYNAFISDNSLKYKFLTSDSQNTTITSSNTIQLVDASQSGKAKLQVYYQGDNDAKYIIGEFEFNFIK